jgi:hypothetical protein
VRRVPCLLDPWGQGGGLPQALTVTQPFHWLAVVDMIVCGAFAVGAVTVSDVSFAVGHAFTVRGTFTMGSATPQRIGLPPGPSHREVKRASTRSSAGRMLAQETSDRLFRRLDLLG